MGMAIANSMAIAKINPKTCRKQKNCLSEFSSNSIFIEMLKQVQHDR